MSNRLSEYPIVGFFGLTHLGTVTSTVLSSLGVKTVCYDKNKSLVEDLREGKTPILEPNLENLIQVSSQNQHFTYDIKDLHECSLIYISIDIPTESNGASDLQPIRDAVEQIVHHFTKVPIVILSQVTPGFTRGIDEKIDNPVYYQVETLIFGQAVNRSLQQARIIVGKRDESDVLPQPYHKILEIYECPILISNYETAELTKVAINSFLAVDVTLTNTLAELCEHLDADWNDVVQALILDKRIGKYRYLKPGLGISGGNIERDLQTLVGLGKFNSVNTVLLEAIIESNLHHRKWVQRKIQELQIEDLSDKIVGILGLSYKKDTNSTKNSVALEIASALPTLTRLLLHDPVVRATDFELGHDFEFMRNSKALIESSDIIIICTPWDQYSRELNNPSTLKLFVGKILIDPFNVLNEANSDDFDIKYFSRGKSLKV
jgi:UDPglucose 6-dehydrogenase